MFYEEPEQPESRKLTMSQSQEDIIDDILHYLKSVNLPFSSWYIGIATSPTSKLFYEHDVSVNSHWIYRHAESDQAAMEIADYLRDNYGLQGRNCHTDRTTRYVYAFAMTNGTKQ